MRIWAAFLALSSSAAANDSLVSIGDPKYLANSAPDGRIRHLRYPTLGCPSIVKSGSTGRVLLKLESPASTFTLTITSNSGDGPGYVLPVTGSGVAGGVTTVHYQVPPYVPDDTYDLVVSVPAFGITELQYNCFRVVAEETGDFRFFVLSDTHFSNPTGFLLPANHNHEKYDALTIIRQMKKEIRALRPAFVLLTGDLMFGLNYDFEYESVWTIWKDAGFPIFMVPGNHDGLASLRDRWLLGIHCPKRDGLDYWRKYFGPCYYSFRFGGVHFQGVNSIDGPPERRDAFLIFGENYGGDLTPEQMAWISADLAGATGAVVPFLHHNPMGPYRPNGTFHLSQWLIRRVLEFLLQGSVDYFTQIWNSQATGAFLLAQYASVPVVFVGHHHIDEIMMHGTTAYRHVTTAGATVIPGSGDYWGYAPVRVENGRIVEHVYTSDPKFLSIPTGNLHVLRPDGRTAEIRSGLPKPHEVTIEFVVPAAASYAAKNGTVVRAAPIDPFTAKVWVKATTPVAASIHEPRSLVVTLDPVPGAPASGGGSPRPGGCGLLGIELLLLFAFRRRTHGSP